MVPACIFALPSRYASTLNARDRDQVLGAIQHWLSCSTITTRAFLPSLTPVLWVMYAPTSSASHVGLIRDVCAGHILRECAQRSHLGIVYAERDHRSRRHDSLGVVANVSRSCPHVSPASPILLYHRPRRGTVITRHAPRCRSALIQARCHLPANIKDQRSALIPTTIQCHPVFARTRRTRRSQSFWPLFPRLAYSRSRLASFRQRKPCS